MKKILKDALDNPELCAHLNGIASDDKCAIEALSDESILKEAKYVLSKYTDGSEGYSQYDEYQGDCGPEAQKEARANVAQIRKFLKKHAAK